MLRHFLGQLSAAPVPRAALVLAGALMLYCQPSAYIAQKHTRYDFRTEGYLSPHMLQVIGRFSGEEVRSRRACLERALDQALRRAVRVILHTHFEIRPDAVATGSLASLGGDQDSFEASYPFRFTERDHVRGQLAFDLLLKKAYLALQDARTPTECMVVLRIEGTDLPEQIRQTRVAFRPEQLDKAIAKRRRQETDPEAKHENQTQPNNP